jgi:ATP-binding cassette, subfamily B, bacterial
VTLPGFLTPANRRIWACILALAFGQAVALAAGVVGTRLAFASLGQGTVSQAALWLMIGSALGLAILHPGLRLLAEELGQRYTADLRKSLLTSAMATAPERIAHRRRGYLMLRLTGDMTAFKDGLSRSLPPIIQAGSLIPTALVVLFWIDARYGLGGVGVVVISLGITAFSAPRLLHHHAMLRQTRAKLAADMAERLPIAPDLARFGRRKRELSRLGRATTALRQMALNRLVQVEVLRALPGAIGGLPAVFILSDGAARGLAAGEIAAGLAALGILVRTCADIAVALDRLAGWHIAREKMTRAFALDVVKAKPAGLVRLSGRSLTIHLQASGGVMVPDQVHVPPGGRATLFAADRFRLLQAVTGQSTDPEIRVSLNGMPLAALTIGTIRRSIAVLGASPIVLKGTLRRNLCLGLMGRPTDQTLHRRIAKACLTTTLNRLGGLDGHIGEGARALTMKDRLRLAALQAAVQRPALLIVTARRADLLPELSGYLDSELATILVIDAMPVER